MSGAQTEEELRLTVRKLQLEVDELEHKAKWQGRLGAVGHIGTILLPYAALIFTVYQFSLQQEGIRDSIYLQIKAQEESANRAFMAPMLAKQADYYFAAVTAAAQFVSSSDEKVKHKAAENFLELYWGPLVMFESPTIVKGMRTMKFCIEHQSSCSDGERQMLSLYLGSALQKDYFNSWRLAPSAFAGRTHDYQHSLDNVADSVWEKIKTEGKESIPPSVSSRSDKKPH